MSLHSWTMFALFWAMFVITPGPNAVNCIANGMALGFRRALPGVAAILTQATLLLILSALGVGALVAASPAAFGVLKLLGAAFLIYLGLRGWIMARRPVRADTRPAAHIYLHALAIATINPKSLAGYLAAFSLFVQADVPIASQIWAIMPTALTLTLLSYLAYTALGAGLGRSALGAVANTTFRRIMAICFILYGLALGLATTPGKA